MIRRFVAAVVAAGLLTLSAGPGQAGPTQIEDAAGDHPVPFMDLTSVGLALTSVKGSPALEVTFTTSGAITPESRATMTGYSLTSKVGSCDLLVRFVGYPDDAFAAAGFATARCGEGGRDAGGTFKITENTVTVVTPLRDLKAIGPGAKMTELAAFTSPGEGMYHDDTTAPSALGDHASSDKPWVIS